MYGVLGEDQSDAKTIKAIMSGMVGGGSTIHAKGFGGGSKLLKAGAGHIRYLQGLGCTKFVVCHDSDCDDPSLNRRKIEEQVVPSGVADRCCILIPVHEIEAWILADIKAVTHIFKSWKPAPIQHPETIPDPKKELERLSRSGVSRPRYNHAVHNPKIAEHLDVIEIERKCPSFRPLVEFLKQA